MRYSQLQSGTPLPGQDHYSGMLDCLRKIVKNEGYVITDHHHPYHQADI